ncbi:MAG: sugar phosphate nucleotidyltransferase [Sulfolobales archaeon]
MSGLTVAILAGGFSEKLHLLSGEINKTYIKIMGKSILEYILESLKDINPQKIILITDDVAKGEEIIKGRIIAPETRVQKQSGAGILGAFKTVGDLLTKEDQFILVVYGDIIVSGEAYRSIVAHVDELRERDLGGVFLGVAEEPRRNHWLIESDERGFVKNVSPSTISVSGYIAGGIYLVRREFFELVDKFDELYKIFNEYVRKYRVKLLHWGHYWVDIGSPWDLLKANYVLLSELRVSRIHSSAKISQRAIIEGPVIIEEDAEIDHYALIKGPVYIGRGVFVGAYSFIRDHTSIGDEASIASNVEINRSFIMHRATIGRGSYVSYTVIGSEAVLEPNVLIKSVSPREYEEAYKSIIRGRRYLKLGAVVYGKARVSAGRVLEAGEEVERE